MEKAKLVKWLLINNIYIDEYLYLLFDKEINQNLFIEFNNLFAKYNLFR